MRTAAMSLAELLSFRDRYVVPEFQRVYGWGETELDRLFADLENAMRGKGARFFLGTIYLADAKGEALIADGQQRILTATMVHAVARDLTDSPAEAERLHALLARPGGKDFRFVPRERDAAFFRTWVQERGATLLPLPTEETPRDGEPDAAELSESQLNIIRNRDAIVERLRALGAEGRRRLIEFHKTITVIVIMADTLEEARNAYASTQTRGLRQSETDKLKAELIGDCAPAQRARLAGQWEECEAGLGRDDFAELFQHLVAIESERRPQHALEADLFRVFSLPRNVASFIEGVLVPSAEAYRRICRAGEDTTRKTRKIDGALISLLRCTHNAWKAPAILAVRDLAAAPRLLEAFLADLERLASVLMIIGADPYRTQERYAAVIRDIKKKALASSTALHLDAKDLALARECLQSSRFAHRDRFRMPVLLKLNDILAKEAQPIDPREVSCEHILPVNPPRRGPWRTTFRTADGRYNGGTFAHMLGNITILTHAQNREADNSPYDDKRGILKRSGFALSKHAAAEKAWTAEVIARRSDALFDLLVRAWRLHQAG